MTAYGFDSWFLSNQTIAAEVNAAPFSRNSHLPRTVKHKCNQFKITFLKIYIAIGAQGQLRHLFTVWGRTDLVQEAWDLRGISRQLHGTGPFPSFYQAFIFQPKYNNNKHIEIESKNKLLLNILLLYNWRLHNKILLDFFPKYLHKSEQRKKPQLPYPFIHNLYLCASDEDHKGFQNREKSG